MQFDAPLIPATLVRREKRFLAHCLLEDGRAIVAHCPNTGSMLGCAAPGSRVWLSESDRPGRKYRHTWESWKWPVWPWASTPAAATPW